VIKFLDRFFPASKNMEVKATIAAFVKGSNEPVSEAREIFKALLIKCPNHGFYVEMQVQSSFGRLVLFKTIEEVITIIEFMAPTLRGHHGRMPKKGVLELNSQDAPLA